MDEMWAEAVRLARAGLAFWVASGGCPAEVPLLPTPNARDGRGLPGEHFENASLPRAIAELERAHELTGGGG